MATRASAAAPAFDPSNGRIEAALSLRAQGRLEEALAILPDSRPFSQDECVLRGDLHLELGQLQKAIESYSAAVSVEPGNVYARQNLALCLRGLNRWAQAAGAFRSLLEQDSHRDNARIGLGECLLRLNRAEEAVACFDSCWTEAARVPALFGKAVAFQLLHRFEDAEAAYLRLLEMGTNTAEVLSNLVTLSVGMADHDRVRRYSQQLSEASPQSLIALQGLAVSALESGSDEDAALHFSRLITLARDGEPPRSNGSGPSIEHRLSDEAAARLDRVRRQVIDQGGV